MHALLCIGHAEIQRLDLVDGHELPYELRMEARARHVPLVGISPAITGWFPRPRWEPTTW